MVPPRAAHPAELLARRAAELASELKATDIVVLDLRGVTDMTDFFVIVSGTSDTHVRAIAQHVQAGLKTAGVSTNQMKDSHRAGGRYSTTWIAWCMCSTRRCDSSTSLNGCGAMRRRSNSGLP